VFWECYQCSFLLFRNISGLMTSALNYKNVSIFGGYIFLWLGTDTINIPSLAFLFLNIVTF
jgi:hypothetical protein